METPTLKETVPDVVVAGRTFRACTTTSFRQDLYVMKLVTEAGLKEIAAKVDLTNSEALSDSAQEIIIGAYASGKLFELLGAVMMEEGKAWSEESAKTNAEFFANLTSGDDKNALKGSIVAVILGFFVSGLLASKTSGISLKSDPEASESPFGPDGVLRTSESGTQSSES